MMLEKLGRLVGALKRRIPAMESGILLSDPTRLYVVALVLFINHIELKLIPSPKSPLVVITIQNDGIFSSGLRMYAY